MRKDYATMGLKQAALEIESDSSVLFFFFQAEDGIRDVAVTGVQTCALPISHVGAGGRTGGRERASAGERRRRGRARLRDSVPPDDLARRRLQLVERRAGHRRDRKSVV